MFAIKRPVNPAKIAMFAIALLVSTPSSASELSKPDFEIKAFDHEHDVIVERPGHYIHEMPTGTREFIIKKGERPERIHVRPGDKLKRENS